MSDKTLKIFTLCEREPEKYFTQIKQEYLARQMPLICQFLTTQRSRKDKI